jgi:hypothetical protein
MMLRKQNLVRRKAADVPDRQESDAIAEIFPRC